MREASTAPRFFAGLHFVSCRAWGMSFCPNVNRTKMFHVKRFCPIRAQNRTPAQDCAAGRLAFVALDDSTAGCSRAREQPEIVFSYGLESQ